MWCFLKKYKQKEQKTPSILVTENLDKNYKATLNLESYDSAELKSWEKYNWKKKACLKDDSLWEEWIEQKLSKMFSICAACHATSFFADWSFMALKKWGMLNPVRPEFSRMCFLRLLQTTSDLYHLMKGKHSGFLRLRFLGHVMSK